MTLRLLLSLSLLAATLQSAHAQELNATVTVNAIQLTIFDPAVIEEFEEAVSNFLNNTQFSEQQYEPEERITANFTFTITSEVSETQFLAEMLVQSARPVYGSDYQSTLINYLDKPAVIEYEQYQPLEFSQNTFTTQLVALLSFYANIIIGMDKDSFAPMAGETAFRRAEQIMSTIPPAVSGRDKSWSNSGNQRSRYRLMQEILNPRARPYRQLMYDYHRQGIDLMSADPVAGRVVMGASLENLNKLRSDVPNSLLISNFSSAKTEEIIDVFLPAPVAERRAAYQILANVDPSNINKFRMLR